MCCAVFFSLLNSHPLSSLFRQLKSALDTGAVTKQDVAELEKMMGIDVKQLVKMMGSGQVDKNKLKELGSDVTDLLDVFTKLAKIKG